MKQIKRTLYVCMCMLLVIVLAGCANNDNQTNGNSATPASSTYFIFDTVITVRVFDESMTADKFDEIKQLLEKIDKQMNRQNKGSEIDIVNQQAGIQPMQVSDATFSVVKTALQYAETSKGAFDPTVGPLVDLWGIGKEGASVPPTEQIEAILPLIDYKSVTIDEDQKTIYLHKKGMSLDLGAIAKGYAADIIAQYLTEQGFTSAIIDLGGNVVTLGKKPGGTNWSIGIQDPAEKRSQHLGLLKVNNKTIVTSGVYERFFKENDVVYHHILNPRDGYPVNNDLLSVTIITDISMDADAMSTAVFSLGIEDGLRFIEEKGNTEAIFVSHNKEVYITSGLEENFNLTNGGYRLAK